MIAERIARNLLRPPKAPRTRILFLPRHAPLAPDCACAAFPGDGGYPAYYRRVWSVLSELGHKVTTANEFPALYRHCNEIDLVFSLYNRAPIDNLETPDFEADAQTLWAAAGPIDYLRLDYRFDPVTGKRVGRSCAICLVGAQWGLSQADILGHVVEFSLRRQRRETEARRWAV